MKTTFAVVLSLVLVVGWSVNGNADIVNGETSSFVFDFSDGISTGSAASGSNAYVSVTPYVAESPNEITSNDSGIGGISNKFAYVQSHITGSPGSGPFDAYQTFSVLNGDPANRFSLNSISFVMSQLGLGAPFNIGQLKVDVWISNDGFATHTEVGGGLLERTSSSDPTPSPLTVNLDLTGFAEFQEVSNDVDIRFVFTDTFNDNQIETRVDDVTLNLTAIPEPGVLPALGLVLMLGLTYRRRQK